MRVPLCLLMLLSSAALFANPMFENDAVERVPLDCTSFSDFISDEVMTLSYTASLGEACVTIESTLFFDASGTASEWDSEGNVLSSFSYEVADLNGQCVLSSPVGSCGAQILAFNNDNSALTLTADGEDASLTPVAESTDDWNIWQSYVILNSGLDNVYMAGGLNPDAVHPSFDGADFGSLSTDGSTLILNGGEIKTYKDNSANVCGGNIQYRVYANGETPGIFNAVSLGFAADLGNGNQKWNKDDAGVDLLNGLTPGDYTLEIYWDADGDTFGGCGSTNYESNNGANYAASFSVFTPTYGCTDPAYTEYDSSANTDDGSCETLSRCSSQTIDGHIYSVLEIGDQCWFAENLRSAVYADGSAIPEATNNGTWSNLNSGGQSIYDNDPSNLDDYGRLYNWHAVEDSRGLCPSGYSVPDDSDVQTLIDEIGGQGALKLKSTSGWTAGPNGTDDYGFDGRPAGFRGASGSFANLTTLATWWTSSPNLNGGDAHVYSLIDNSDEVYRQYGISRQQGRSIRCVQNILEGCPDVDSDGICDDQDNCTDLTANNYNDPANGVCQPCGTAPVFLGLAASSPAVNMTEANGVVTLDITSGSPITLQLTGLNGTPDVTATIPTEVGTIPAGYYEARVIDADGCLGVASSPGGSTFGQPSVYYPLIMPYTQCCSGCGIYDADTDGICDDSDNCINRRATNFADPANVICIVPGCMDADYLQYDPEATVDDGSCSTLAPTCVSPSMDGYSYGVVEIGDQCWFAENLRTTVYADGSAIPEVTGNNAWAGLSSGARCDYDNDASNVATYGRMYNGYAVDDTRGLCPTGWHVPTDDEWTALETYLGANGHSGAEGTALKSTSGWSGNGNGTDDFGFSALPGGLRFDYGGTFANAGATGNWWSSSPSGGNAWFRYLNNSNPDVFRFFNPRGLGFSVRCLRDAD